MPENCPSCGARAEGNFCSECGGALRQRRCLACGAGTSGGDRFCTACGVRIPGLRAVPRGRFPILPWVVAGVAVLGLVLVLLFRSSSPQPPLAVPTQLGGAGPPDLSQMTPRQQFDRLYNRIMSAAEQGDTTTVFSFSPMALQAYRNLESVDADARYHAAMLQLHSGSVAAAGSLADSILAEDPGHLFGFVVRAGVSSFTGDSELLRRAHAGFLAAWDEEIGSGRPEYQDHRPMLDEFERTARTGERGGS